MQDLSKQQNSCNPQEKEDRKSSEYADLTKLKMGQASVIPKENM